ncbi:MAG: PAS domain-containing protein, partial [Pseudomonadota bacterium]
MREIVAQRDFTDTLAAHLGLDSRESLATLAGIVLTASLIIFAVTGSGFGQPLLIGLMGLLSVFGLFFVFLALAGHIRLSDRIGPSDIAQWAADDLNEAIQLTRQDGTAVWSNAKFSSLVRGELPTGIQSLEAALGGSQAVSQVVFRIMRAVEEQRPASEDITVRPQNNALGDAHAVRIVRISVKPFAHPLLTREAGPLTLWRIRDITPEVASTEALTSGMQTTLDWYDNLPVGVLAVASDGDVRHWNATLGRWLGLERTDGSKRPLSVHEMIPEETLRLLLQPTGSQSAPSSCDVDLIGADGCVLPVKLMARHPSPERADNLTGKPTGKPAGEPTIITVAKREHERAASTAEHADLLQASRLFTQAPFGIAALDRDGNILSTNATFCRMVVDATGGVGQTAADILTGTTDAETAQSVRDVLARALSGKAKIAPVEISAGPDAEQTRRLYLNALPGASENGEAAVLYLIDVTEQKALERKFAQSQ